MKDQITYSQIKKGLQTNKTTNGHKTHHTDAGSANNKQLLRNWGFKMAAQLNASLGGLRTSMERIMNSYLSEIKDLEMPQKNQIHEEIVDIDQKKKEKFNEIKLVKEKQAQLKDTVEQNKQEMEEIRIDSEGEFLFSEFSWVKVILLTLFVSVLGMALIFFYSSLINNAVFADFTQRINEMNMNDLSIFNSIIDVKLLFNNAVGTYLSYGFSVVFLAIGLLVHFNYTKSKVLNSIIKVVLIGIGLFTEILFAYKIENNIYELKLMTGFIDKKPDFWAMIISKDVLIVITLGFISYLIWSFLLEVSLKEWEKRNPKKMAVIKIREIKRVIGRLNRQLGELKSELVKLDNELSLLEDRVKNLKTKLSHIFFDKNEASRRLTDFFSGWLHYINLNSAYSSHRSDYEQEFEKYRNELINQ